MNIDKMGVASLKLAVFRRMWGEIPKHGAIPLVSGVFFVLFS